MGIPFEIQKSEFQNPNAGKMRGFFQWIVLNFITRSAWINQKFQDAGDVSKYVNWVKLNFSNPKFFSRREKVWIEIESHTRSEFYIGIELGVAYGYLSNWWVTRSKHFLLEWHGFDTFTGMPENWRSLRIGSFSTLGKVPNIDDKRVKWHIGDARLTLPKFNFELIKDARAIVFFDFDLFEPSLIAWLQVRSFLKTGDILYFDEAYDAAEQKLINEYIFKEFEISYIASTHMALAIQVVGRRKSE